ncbi:adenylyl cyclase alpha, putative, partial [Plasmodium malariae]
MKFINMNIPNGTKKDEEEIVLNDTIKELSTNKKKKKGENIRSIKYQKYKILEFSFIVLFYFTSELNVLLFPIEGILKKLKLMKSNPTLALEMQEELLNHELDNILRNSKLKRKSINENYEILKMEENLMKLGTLMLL